MHVDHAIALSDFEATPRRDVVSIWLWLSDVEEERAAMRIGAHDCLLGVFSRWAASLTRSMALPLQPPAPTGTSARTGSG